MRAEDATIGMRVQMKHYPDRWGRIMAIGYDDRQPRTRVIAVLEHDGILAIWHPSHWDAMTEQAQERGEQ